VSQTTVIRYRTRPDAGDENARLVAAVYAALAELEPRDFAYATYRLADGVTFVHVARLDAKENPLAKLPAFVEFQRELQDRCVEQPAPSPATVVGSYGWPT
jgi:dipeptidyl aminopeptidase/acylaminoacyl peptidase